MNNPFLEINTRLDRIETILLDSTRKESEEEKPYYTRREAKIETGLSLSTIDRLLSNGDLTRNKILSKTVIPGHQIRDLKARLSTVA